MNEKAKVIAKAIEDMFEACLYIKEDCEACGDCPVHGICLYDTPFIEVADFLHDGVIKDFLKYAYNGEAEAYRYENMSEDERRWNDLSELANVERSELDD